MSQGRKSSGSGRASGCSNWKNSSCNHGLRPTSHQQVDAAPGRPWTRAASGLRIIARLPPAGAKPRPSRNQRSVRRRSMTENAIWFRGGVSVLTSWPVPCACVRRCGCPAGPARTRAAECPFAPSPPLQTGGTAGRVRCQARRARHDRAAVHLPEEAHMTTDHRRRTAGPRPGQRRRALRLRAAVPGDRPVPRRRWRRTRSASCPCGTRRPPCTWPRGSTRPRARSPWCSATPARARRT